jgi:ATP-dependent DNA ligase
MPLRRVREPFDNPRGLYELKVDGSRALAHVDRGEVVLMSRRGHRFRRSRPDRVYHAAHVAP